MWYRGELFTPRLITMKKLDDAVMTYLKHKPVITKSKSGKWLVNANFDGPDHSSMDYTGSGCGWTEISCDSLCEAVVKALRCIPCLDQINNGTPGWSGCGDYSEAELMRMAEHLNKTKCSHMGEYDRMLEYCKYITVDLT